MQQIKAPSACIITNKPFCLITRHVPEGERQIVWHWREIIDWPSGENKPMTVKFELFTWYMIIISDIYRWNSHTLTRNLLFFCCANAREFETINIEKSSTDKKYQLVIRSERKKTSAANLTNCYYFSSFDGAKYSAFINNPARCTSFKWVSK